MRYFPPGDTQVVLIDTQGDEQTVTINTVDVANFEVCWMKKERVKFAEIESSPYVAQSEKFIYIDLAAIVKMNSVVSR
ncbi:hypothetical protein ACQ4M3_07845 [Leptolyngbya sp. AN03gr2]|uniref:hypothetical protein n=1 Tax=unclassified Leptolyngbya TaxID=2650499 RepID=UPI003D324321